MTTTITRLAAAVAVLAVVMTAAARLEAAVPGPRAYLHSYNLPAHGIAIEGYSPVSYFSKGQAVQGSPEFAVEHDGVTYHLASADEQRQFRADPAKYIPAYGGWCAFGMAVQDKFPIDPTNFKIVDGKLLLFLKNPNVDALSLWNKESEGDLVRKAEAHWAKVSK